MYECGEVTARCRSTESSLDSLTVRESATYETFLVRHVETLLIQVKAYKLKFQKAFLSFSFLSFAFVMKLATASHFLIRVVRYQDATDTEGTT